MATGCRGSNVSCWGIPFQSGRTDTKFKSKRSRNYFGEFDPPRSCSCCESK